MKHPLLSLFIHICLFVTPTNFVENNLQFPPPLPSDPCPPVCVPAFFWVGDRSPHAKIYTVNTATRVAGSNSLELVSALLSKNLRQRHLSICQVTIYCT